MGKRHQIYLALPFEVNVDGKSSNIIGVHKQWFFGKKPLEYLKQVILFCDNPGDDHVFVSPLNNTQKAFNVLYSLNPQIGEFYEAEDLTNEVLDPEKIENDSGITIIDVRDKDNLKYCFFFLENHGLVDVKEYTPLTAKEYAEVYYGKDWYAHEISLVNIYYNEEDKRKKLLEDAKNWQEEVFALAEQIDTTVTRLSPEEVKQLFPSLTVRG